MRNKQASTDFLAIKRKTFNYTIVNQIVYYTHWSWLVKLPITNWELKITVPKWNEIIEWRIICQSKFKTCLKFNTQLHFELQSKAFGMSECICTQSQTIHCRPVLWISSRSLHLPSCMTCFVQSIGFVLWSAMTEWSMEMFKCFGHEICVSSDAKVH